MLAFGQHFLKEVPSSVVLASPIKLGIQALWRIEKVVRFRMVVSILGFNQDEPRLERYCEDTT